MPPLKERLKGTFPRSEVIRLWENFKPELVQEMRRLIEEMSGENGVLTLKGDRGHSPKKGVDYFTPKEVAQLKKELKGKPGRPGLDGYNPNPKEIAEVVLNQLPKVKEFTGDVLVEKINTAGKKIKLEQVENLKEAIQSVSRRKGGGGGGSGNWITDNSTGDGSTTAFTLTSNVASGGTAIMVLLNGQVQERTTHYTVSGKTVTFTTAPENNMAIHFWYIRR